MATSRRKGVFRSSLLLLSCFFLAGCFVFYRWWTLSFDTYEWALLLVMNGVLLIAGIYLICSWIGREEIDGEAVSEEQEEQVRRQEVSARLKKYAVQGEDAEKRR